MKSKNKRYILWYSEISSQDVPLVGGKNASLGEMFSNLSKKGVLVPDGFATTSFAFWHFMEKTGLKKKIGRILEGLDVSDIKNLQERGKKVRKLIFQSKIPDDLEKEIVDNYYKLSQKYGEKETDVAVRTSATAEDLPQASFAGQYETYLNVKGKENLLKAVKKCLSSLFTDRAIFYRVQHNFSQLEIALSVGIQKMVRSDLAASGVMFSLDTESGFKEAVLVNGSYGLGEMIVQGKITPDEFYVFKPTLKKGYSAIISKTLGKKNYKFVYQKNGGIRKVKVSKNDQQKFCLSDKEILTLAKWACIIEEHYSNRAGKWMPMDIEWAKDGKTNQLFIVQARPETVHAREKGEYYYQYQIKETRKPILKGIAIGSKIGQGKVHKILDVKKLSEFKKGEVLVTKMTSPDWVPAMKMASAIITDEGGRSCHAAIISRELGIPCIVGTEKATKVLKNQEEITIDCSQGLEGKIYKGKVSYEVKKYDLGKTKNLKTEIMVNLGAPEIAFKTSFLPVEGVGLAREEFIIGEKIKIHPLALYYYQKLKKDKKNKKIVKKIDKLTVGYKDKKQYFIDKLAEGIGTIAAAFYPKKVIVRFSDFKTNEYRQLVGGELFEPEENNPMIGWRGASRYYDKNFKEAFLMEVKAIKKAREIFGLKNIAVMVPFCRTIEEGRKIIELAKRYGLKRKNLDFYVMCEIPSNAILIEEFLEIFDGVSIGSNDLTQLILGIDRDNARISHIGNEENEAVKKMIAQAIKVCREKKKYCGICGDAPSSLPNFAKFLIENKIHSISLSPDAVIKTILMIANQ